MRSLARAARGGRCLAWEALAVQLPPAVPGQKEEVLLHLEPPVGRGGREGGLFCISPPPPSSLLASGLRSSCPTQAGIFSESSGVYQNRFPHPSFKMTVSSRDVCLPCQLSAGRLFGHVWSMLVCVSDVVSAAVLCNPQCRRGHGTPCALERGGFQPHFREVGEGSPSLKFP